MIIILCFGIHHTFTVINSNVWHYSIESFLLLFFVAMNFVSKLKLFVSNMTNDLQFNFSSSLCVHDLMARIEMFVPHFWPNSSPAHRIFFQLRNFWELFSSIWYIYIFSHNKFQTTLNNFFHELECTTHLLQCALVLFYAHSIQCHVLRSVF